MEKKPVTDGLLRTFNVMFILVIASFFLADALRAARMGPYSLVVVLIALVPWAVTLGVAARRLGRSPALWCGLSLVTLPFGLFIGHVLMFRRLKAALAAQAQVPIPQN